MWSNGGRNWIYYYIYETYAYPQLPLPMEVSSVFWIQAYIKWTKLVEDKLNNFNKKKKKTKINVISTSSNDV